MSMSKGVKIDDSDITKYAEQVSKIYRDSFLDVALGFAKIIGSVQDKLVQYVNIVRTSSDKFVVFIQ